MICMSALDKIKENTRGHWLLYGFVGKIKENTRGHWLLYGFVGKIKGNTLKCYFTSTETGGLLGTGAQDGHLDFHTIPGLCRETRVSTDFYTDL